MKFWQTSGLLGLSLLLAACGSDRPIDVASATGTMEDWLGHGGTSDETAYSALENISRDNIDQLGLAWSLDLPGEHSLEATPLAVDGVLYFSGGLATVYAVDGLTGNLLWTYDPTSWMVSKTKWRYTLPNNRGVAYEKGRVFVATVDGRLIALNAKTGQEEWSVRTLPVASPATITSAPRTFNGKVIVGQGGADYPGARGYVTAYDQVTGKQAWRFYIIPGTPAENKGDPAMERAAKTWNGEFWKNGGGGGNPWDSITFDKEFNRIYVPTANPFVYDPEVRSPGGGDNLYTSSIVALDADTGKYLWHYQVNPRDAWDFDATQQVTLAELTIDGKKRKVLMQAPKNGFFYVIDRTDGTLISAGKFGKVNWADSIDLKSGRPVERENIRYQNGSVTIFPSPLGAHNWQTMSFSPKTGLAYIPYMQLGMNFVKAGADVMEALALGVAKEEPEDGKGSLIAYDPIAQKVRWKVQHDDLWNGGTLAIAGGVVFQGNAAGYFVGYDAATGKQLWRFNAGLGIIAAPISYSIQGEQYVSVLVGYGASNGIGDVATAGWKFGAQPRRLLTFKLGGNVKLPKTAPRDFSVTPYLDPSITISDADAKAGASLYGMNCSMCHGANLVSPGSPGPDLRESAIAADFDTLKTVLQNGSLASRGMPQFDNLDANQVRGIHAFIRKTTRDSAAGKKNAGDASAARIN